MANTERYQFCWIDKCHPTLEIFMISRYFNKTAPLRMYMQQYLKRQCVLNLHGFSDNSEAVIELCILYMIEFM